MDYRKLIKFGNNSYVISLPKEWLKKNQLDKGNLIYLNENSNNEIVLAPTLSETQQESKETILNVDNKDARRIRREIISAYLNNFSVIKLTGENIQKNTEVIRDTIHSLMGLEIIEQTKDKTLIRDFLNIRDISLNELMRKMDIITRSMMSDIPLCFQKDHAINIDHRGQDVLRMSFVILRAIRRGLKDPEYAKNLQLTSLQLFEIWNTASQIKFIADQIREIAHFFPILEKIPSKEKEQIKQYLKQLTELYSNVMKAFYTEDIQLANKMSQTKNCLRKETTELLKKLYTNKKGLEYLAYTPLFDRLSTLANEINKIARRIYS
tara:strand:+ start:14009 stop:14977 length:969 start_codon:yes stop_codon:yes gene_type:complete